LQEGQQEEGQEGKEGEEEGEEEGHEDRKGGAGGKRREEEQKPGWQEEGILWHAEQGEWEDWRNVLFERRDMRSSYGREVQALKFVLQERHQNLGWRTSEQECAFPGSLRKE
jgi:hypothetical protein